jgi:hypothetical protein
MIRLDGLLMTNSLATGLRLQGTGHRVRGLVVANFFDGIALERCNACVVAGNFIGLDLDGLPSLNRGNGVYLTAPAFGRSTGNVIGGTNPADRNVIAGNGTGIFVFGGTVDNNAIQGNYIGTDATGTLPRGNTGNGIFIQSAPTNLIGGVEAGAGNLISANGFANSQRGISLLGATGTRIFGNQIGTDVSGYYDLGNAGAGIGNQGSDRVVIGGTDPGSGNLIANNRQAGLWFLGGSSNLIQGNILGTDPAGMRVLGNRGYGIELNSTSRHVIGGSSAGANVIRFSGKAGVKVNGGQGNAIRFNRIFGNRGLAIDLDTEGVTSNDQGDADSGGNALQNFPVITNVTASASSTEVRGYLSSSTNHSFTLDFYASSICDNSGHGAGEFYLGLAGVTTGADGIGGFSVTLPVKVLSSQVLTATATDSTNSTSEFSACAAVSGGEAGVSLSIRLLDKTNVVSWPSSATGFVLESASILASTNQWTLVTNTVVDDGAERAVAIPNPPVGSHQFFRLRKP